MKKRYLISLFCLVPVLMVLGSVVYVYHDPAGRTQVVEDIPDERIISAVLYMGEFESLEDLRPVKWVIAQKRKDSELPLFVMFDTEYEAQRKFNFYSHASWMDMRDMTDEQISRVQALHPDYKIQAVGSQ